MALLMNKVAIITGAVTGIGRAIALEYLRQGASVAVNYFPDARSEDDFKSLQSEAGQYANLLGVPGDISLHGTATELVAKTVVHFGKLDVLVSNAGVCKFVEFLS